MSIENTSATTASYAAKPDSFEDAVYDAAVDFLEYTDGGATLENIHEYVENSRVWSRDVSATRVRRILEEGEDVSIGVTGIYQENGEPVPEDERELRPVYVLEQ